MDMYKNTFSNEESIKREESGYKRSLSWWNLVRWLSTIGFLGVGIILMGMEGRDFQLQSFIMILIAINLLNLVYSFWLVDIQHNKFFPILHNLMDVIIFSLAISMTGGIKSPLIWSYLIPIITSSITIGKTTGFFACIFSLVGLVVVVLQSQGIDFREMLAFSPQMQQELLYHTPKIISYTCLFFLTYFISSFLSESLRRQNRVLILLNNLLDKRNRDIMRAQAKVRKMEEIATINRLARTFQHELNNPLAVISMNTELLLKENGQKGKAFERIKAVDDGVRRIKTVIGKLERLYQPAYRQAIHDIDLIDLEESVERSVT